MICPMCSAEFERDLYGPCATCVKAMNDKAALNAGVRYLFYGIANKSIAKERVG